MAEKGCPRRAKGGSAIIYAEPPGRKRGGANFLPAKTGTLKRSPALLGKLDSKRAIWNIRVEIGGKIQIPPAPSQNITAQEVATACAPPPPPDPRPCRYASRAKCERKQALVDQVKTMHEQGHSTYEIAASLRLARNTIRRYLRLEGPVQPTPRTRRLSQLDPFYDYLTERWNDGCSNAHQLFVELQEKGYRGGETTVRSFVAHLRQGLSGMARPPKHAKEVAPPHMTI